jgi:hypothetical protein
MTRQLPVDAARSLRKLNAPKRVEAIAQYPGRRRIE